MTDTLRDRIAAAIAAHEPVTDYGGADGECIECDLNPRWPDSEASTGPTAGWKRHATHLADAVIAELRDWDLIDQLIDAAGPRCFGKGER